MSRTNEPARGVRIYVSHASEDSERAQKLVRRLERSPSRFVVASTRRSKTQAWSARKALLNSDKVIALLSESYLARGPHDRELAVLEGRHHSFLAMTLEDVDLSVLERWPQAEVVLPTVLEDDSEWSLFERRLLAPTSISKPRQVGILCAWLDRSFVETEIAPSIAVHGWQPLLQSSASQHDEELLPETVLVVSSQLAFKVEWLEAARKRLSAHRRVVTIVKDDSKQSLVGRLRVDFRNPSSVARKQLLALLPLAEESPATRGAYAPEHWSQPAFSEHLAQAVADRLRATSTRLVATAAGLLRRHRICYPLEALRSDLGKLRGARYFDLLVDLADAAVSAGVNDPNVARQRAQGLIEMGELDLAQSTLNSLIARLEPKSAEYIEAKGLRGRAMKQRYMNAAQAATPTNLRSMATWLSDAIADYFPTYLADPTLNLWHGINALSLLVRAERDGVDLKPSGVGSTYPSPQALAEDILKVVRHAEHEKRLTHWDTATAAEAAVVAGDLKAAEEKLSQYIKNENIDAFSLASTSRQFQEVLGLKRDSKLVRMLESALEGMVAGDALLAKPDPATNPKSGALEAQGKLSFLVRTSEAGWHGSGIVGLEILARLGEVVACRGTQQTLKDVARDSQVLSIERSQAVEPAAVVECNDTVPLVKATAVHLHPLDERGDRAIVAVIDSGIDVRHRAFRDSCGNTRILAVWDQTCDAGPRPRGFSFGTEYDADVINRIIQSSDPGGGGNEGRWGSHEGVAHGTHVTSIAAGSPAGVNFAGGVAPEAGIVVVICQLDGSIGYSASHLAALDYIASMASRLERPVVVNVSLGQNAGAHDGRSPFERSFEVFTGFGSIPGRAIVKSAGNEGATHGHARLTIRPDFPECLEWTVVAQCTAPQQLELWFNSGDKLEFRLGFGPDTSPLVDSQQCPRLEGTFANGTGYKLLYTPRHRDNGDSQLVVQLFPEAAPAIAAGAWRLEIAARATRPNGGRIEAWIERQSAIPRVGRPMVFRNHIHDEMTLSVPGTAHNVIAVGACGRYPNAKLPDFTSYGPTRDQRHKPELCAPGVGITAARSGTIEGVTASCGTSQAAPHVTGAIALLLSRLAKPGKSQANAAQIAQALTQTTQGGAYQYHPAVGYGMLDVEGLLNAF